MGNLNSGETQETKHPYDRSDFKPLNFIKNKFGDVRIVQNIKNSKFYIEKSVYFDSDQRLKELKQALQEIAKANSVNYMKVYAAQLHDRRMLCSASNAVLVCDYFDVTLEDMVQRKKNLGVFSQETALWGFLFAIVEVLQYNNINNIQNNFVHPRAIYYSKEVEGWCLIHHAFFSENNYTEAVSGATNYCSPELYCQTMSKKKTFYLLESDKSNMFSLAVIALQLLYLDDETFQHSFAYNRQTIRVDVYYLHKFVEELKSKGFSKLLSRILNDMIQELEHLRLSPRKFLNLLSGYKSKLTSADFTGHNGVLKQYIDAKSKHDDLSFQEKMSHVYEDNNDQELDISEQFLEDDTLDNLKQKAVPFDPNFMDHDSF